MSKPDKRYYKITISGEEYIFTNVEDIGNGKFMANAVDKNGKIAEYFSTLYLHEIENARISDKFPVPDKLYEYILKGFIVNASEYDNGNKETSGTWISFPAGKDEIKKTLETIGLSENAEQGQYFFDDFKTNIHALRPLLNAYCDIENLQKAAVALDFLDSFNMLKLNAIMETDAKFDNLSQLIEYTYNSDYFDLDFAQNETELGLYLIYNSTDFDGFSEYQKDAIDPVTFGRYIAEMEQGVFTQYGYVYKTGKEWTAVDLPDFKPKTLNGKEEIQKDSTKSFGEDLDKFFRENCEGYSDLADNVFAATESISNNVRIGNTDYIRSQIKNMQKENYLDNADIAPFMKRLDAFDKAKGKTVSKERTKEKPSIRKQLADNKAKAADMPKGTKPKSKDLEV